VQVDIAGPAGRLEALLEEPDPSVAGARAGEPARFAALVCHPHPLPGGTMHNHATYRLAKAVRARGGASLRFNYRGVGRSAGAYDAGRGEADDAAAALAWLAAERPTTPLLACGFSFGAWVAARAGGADPRVRGLLLAGLAIRSPDLDAIRDATEITALEKPIAVLQAARDELGAPSEIEGLLAGSRGPRRLTVVPRCTHLFTEDLAALQREAEEALAWLLGEGA
jgi:alpha/beta superfamily hydrolase